MGDKLKHDPAHRARGGEPVRDDPAARRQRVLQLRVAMRKRHRRHALLQGHGRLSERNEKQACGRKEERIDRSQEPKARGTEKSSISFHRRGWDRATATRL